MRINLALQGGGAHGAFTWGVLDRLLEENSLEIAGISGTSAGAMNAAAVKCGYVEGGAQAAREKLRAYWEDVTAFTPDEDYEEQIFSYAGLFAGVWKEAFKQYGMMPALDAIESSFSPYAHNPFDFNGLRDIVCKHFSPDALRSSQGPKLFVNATNVRSGKLQLFEDDALSPDALLASAALPSLFKAVEIDGEAYWDGGYTANPALFPLIDETDCGDILIVHINPRNRDDIPQSAIDIENRVNEISFNAALVRDLRQIDFIARYLKKNQLDDQVFKTLRLHAIADDELMISLSAQSKIFSNKAQISKLFNAGRMRAESFLRDHGADIGTCSTLDLRREFPI